MPQDVFDSMVVVDLMAGVLDNQQKADSIRNGLIEGRLRSYPSEERGQLKGRYLYGYTFEHPTVDDISKLCGSMGMSDSERRAYVCSVLERTFETMNKNAKAKKSVFRRIFGGTAFNYETQPQIDRVQCSRENIAAATLAVITTEFTRRRAP